MSPGDRAVVCALEPRSMNVAGHALSGIGQQAVVVGEAGHHRQRALGHAEGHFRSARVAPFGDDASAAQDHAVRRPARADRTEDAVAGFTRTEGRHQCVAQIGRRLLAVLACPVHGRGEPGWVEAGFRRRNLGPGIARRHVVLRQQGRAQQPQGEGRERAESDTHRGNSADGAPLQQTRARSNRARGAAVARSWSRTPHQLQRAYVGPTALRRA